MEKILSIIIPTYNMEKYLRHCLDSLIIKENMDKLEVLVINDGSKDTSSAIAHEYQDKYPQTFRVIDKENGNYGSCINRGLKEATGKYVKVLDADDSFDNENLHKFVAILIEVDVDLFITDFVRVDTNGDTIAKHSRELKGNVIFNIESVSNNLSKHFLAMHAATYNSRVFKGLDYHQTEGISYTDNEWMYTPMSAVRTVYYLPIVVYKYLIGREGQTVKSLFTLRNTKHHAMVAMKMIPQLKNVQEPYFGILENKLIYMLECVYTGYLLANSDPNELIQLKDVEESLKRALPAVYDKLNNSVPLGRLKYHYIRDWRKNGSYTSFSFTNRLYKIKDKLLH